MTAPVSRTGATDLPWCNWDHCPEPGQHRITTGRCLIAPCPACMVGSRETVGLVCQTCGTDYGATDREVEAACARCGQVRRTKNMERLAEVVARGSRWMKPVYIEAAWPGAPWICSARTSCKVRRRAARPAALLAEQPWGGLNADRA